MIFGEETSSVAWWLTAGGVGSVLLAVGHFLPKLANFAIKIWRSKKKTDFVVMRGEQQEARKGFDHIIKSYDELLAKQEKRISSMEGSVSVLESKYETVKRDYELMKKDHETCVDNSTKMEKQVAELQHENATLKERVAELENKLKNKLGA